MIYLNLLKNEIKIHKMSECPECQELMKTEGRGCDIWKDESMRDFNFIKNAMEIYED